MDICWFVAAARSGFYIRGAAERAAAADRRPRPGWRYGSLCLQAMRPAATDHILDWPRPRGDRRWWQNTFELCRERGRNARGWSNFVGFRKEKVYFYAHYANSICDHYAAVAYLDYLLMNVFVHFFVQLRQTTVEQSGEYSCTATNDAGSVTTCAILTVIAGESVLVTLIILPFVAMLWW